MLQDKELEIRLQFLEEAHEYLNVIESAVLESMTSGIDKQINAVLRAAHSIKGGAAMMGFQSLSHLAHRLEDIFKILKSQPNVIDAELQSHLLIAVDRLRSCINRYQQGEVVDDQWVEVNANPVFKQLHQRLGDSVAEETEIMASEEDENMLALIFKTEVEECLQRLESVLSSAEAPQLLEEVSVMAQELGSLGEMLELSAFSRLCESINQHLEANPEKVEEIAHLALQEWRRSQAAVLIGAVDTLPTSLPISSSSDSPQDEEPNSVRVSVLPDLNLDFASATEPKEYQDNTVRVPVKLLDQVNDLFGELTINRNSLNLYLERLRNLVRILNQRVRNLQLFNSYPGELGVGEPKNFSSSENLQMAAEVSRASGEIVSLDASRSSKEVAITPENRGDSPKNWLSTQESDSHPLPLEVRENIVRIQEVTDDIDLSLGDAEQTFIELNRTAKQMQTNLIQVRMRPFSDLAGRFPRLLRELSLEYNKNVDLKVQGSDTLIDRAILEALKSPLMHLLRNAFDHGIEDAATREFRGKPEQAVIEMKAAYRGNQTIITISDDGGGIDLDKVRRRAAHLGLDEARIAQASDEELLTLIFEPGFSTADQVTALSGRGVGLDVVRTNLRQIRGDIKVDTKPGIGTTFTLSVPLTLSVARVLLVESNSMLLAFPSDAVAEMLLLNSEQILTVADNPALRWKGVMVPLINLGKWLKFRSPQSTLDSEAMPLMSVPTVLMLPQGNDWAAIQIDRCWGEQEVAVRPVEGAIAMPPGFSSCTILGDGRVVPLVNPPELLHWIATYKQSKTLQQGQPLTPAVSESKRDTILVVDDSINVRRLLALTLEKVGYQVEQAKDGQDALEKLLYGLPIKLVVCDVDMPRLDGYGLLARLRSNPAFFNLPVVMLTSRKGQKERQIAMNLGATAYFSKPHDEQELLQTLRQLMLGTKSKE